MYAWFGATVRYVDRDRRRLFVIWDKTPWPFGERQWVSASAEHILLERGPIWCRYRGPKSPWWPSQKPTHDELLPCMDA